MPAPEQIEIEETKNARPVDAADLALDLAAGMPEPTVKAESGKAETLKSEPANGAPEFTDKRGTLFNPKLHRADSAGRPMRDKNGNFYSANLGRPGKATAPRVPMPQVLTERGAPTFTEPGSGPVSDFDAGPLGAPAAPVADRFVMLAEMYLASGYGPLIVMLGVDVKPDKDEHEALKGSLAAWLRANNATDISQGWAFTLTACAVFISKLEKPTVRQRLQMLGLKAKQFFERLRKKKENIP